MLGFYMSGHPLTSFEDLTRKFTNATTISMANMENGTSVTTAGMITDLRKRMTKNDKQMAFATLEDLDGIADLIVFSETLANCGDMLQEGSIIWIKGAISNGQREREQPCVRADEILSMDALKEKFVTSIHVSLQPSKLDSSVLKTLKDACLNNKGDCNLFLHIKTPRYSDIMIQANPDTRVAPTDALIAEIERIAGEKSVWLDASRSDY